MDHLNTNSYKVVPRPKKMWEKSVGKKLIRAFDPEYMSKTDRIKAHLASIEHRLEEHARHITQQNTSDSRQATYIDRIHENLLAVRKSVTSSIRTIRSEMDRIERHQAIQDDKIKHLEAVAKQAMQAMKQ